MAKIFTITEGLENMGALRSGGQGSVYKGRRTGYITTAVKLLPTPVHTESADDKNYRNFQNEVEKLKKVNEEHNPNVVKILNYGITESGSFPFIEMEYIDGPDLEELLKPPHPPVFMIKEVIKVADQLSCALMHCHKAGVKHGDIKSNNVKFNNASGNYVLLDFGLAIMSDEQRRTSMRNAGAIEFMAPEQNEGKMLLQTDIYSFGIALYELLAGEVPFPLNDNGETARNTVRLAHLEAPVPDLLEKRRAHLPEDWSEEKRSREMQVPDWLLGVIAKCLQKRPEDRYADGIALQEAITDHHTSASDAALLAENERLQTMLMNYQQNGLTPGIPVDSTYQSEPDDSSVRMSKPVFVGLILLLTGFMVFSVYSLFIKRQQPMVAKSVVDTIAKPDTGSFNNQLNSNLTLKGKPKQIDSSQLQSKLPVTNPDETQPKRATDNPDTTVKLERDTSKAQPDN